MWGGDDPDARKPMVWPDIAFDIEASHPITGRVRTPDPVVFDNSLHSYVKMLVRVRHKHPALRRGDMKPLILDDQKGVYAFTRAWEKDTVVVIMNNGVEEQHVKIPLPGVWERAFTAGTVVGTQTDPFSYLMDRKSALILYKAN